MYIENFVRSPCHFPDIHAKTSHTHAMNGDSVRLLVDELFDPWSTRLVDWLFYAGVAIGLGKVVQAVSSLVPGIYTYLYPKPNLRALTLTERYGRWAGMNVIGDHMLLV